MKNRIYTLTFSFSTLILLIVSSLAVADDNEDLKQRIRDLERELAETREKLAEAESQKEDAVQAVAPAKPKESPVKIGGALRGHYVYGDYTNRRGQSPGDADLELFRVNADLNHNNFIGRVEYRWYDGYSMMHTAWLGYDAGDSGTFKAGIVRVPFGPGDYGASTSWFFDQHFYVGLADDMDLGFTWTRPFDKLTVDLAYFIQDEGDWDGASLDGSRYSYDVVKRRGEGGVAEGFDEQHQL